MQAHCFLVKQIKRIVLRDNEMLLAFCVLFILSLKRWIALIFLFFCKCKIYTRACKIQESSIYVWKNVFYAKRKSSALVPSRLYFLWVVIEAAWSMNDIYFHKDVTCMLCSPIDTKWRNLHRTKTFVGIICGEMRVETFEHIIRSHASRCTSERLPLSDYT